MHAVVDCDQSRSSEFHVYYFICEVQFLFTFTHSLTHTLFSFLSPPPPPPPLSLPQAVVDRQTVRCVTESKPNMWFAVALTGGGACRPNAYTLRHYSSWVCCVAIFCDCNVTFVCTLGDFFLNFFLKFLCLIDLKKISLCYYVHIFCCIFSGRGGAAVVAPGGIERRRADVDADPRACGRCEPRGACLVSK